MIKKRIDFNFHINYFKLLDNSNYLLGSIYTIHEENELYSLVKDDKTIYKLDPSYNIELEKYLSYNLSIDVIYYKSDNFIFEYQDNDNLYFETLDNKKISIPLKERMDCKLIYDDKLIIFNIKNRLEQKYKIYTMSLDEIEDRVLTYKEIVKLYRYDENNDIYLKLEPLLPNDHISKVIKHDNFYIVSTYNYDNRYLAVIDENLNILTHKEISNNKNYLPPKLYGYKDFYYVIFSVLNARTTFILRKYDKNLNLLEEETIKTYRCDFITINDKLCLIIDDPKRYDKKLRAFWKQEIMGNSSLLILE